MWLIYFNPQYFFKKEKSSLDKWSIHIMYVINKKKPWQYSIISYSKCLLHIVWDKYRYTYFYMVLADASNTRIFTYLYVIWLAGIPCSYILYLVDFNTAATFEPQWKREVWRFKIWFNPPFLSKCLYQVRVITVFTVFRLLTDFVCLYTCEFWLSLWKIVRSSVILLLPLFII